MLYGASLALEFVALVVLRIREPELARPFRVPGGLAGAILVGVVPTLLLTLSLLDSAHETVLGMNVLAFGILMILAGFTVYFGTGPLRRRHSRTATPESLVQFQGPQ
jgi:amino acid transporter